MYTLYNVSSDYLGGRKGIKPYTDFRVLHPTHIFLIRPYILMNTNEYFLAFFDNLLIFIEASMPNLTLCCDEPIPLML